LSSVSVACGAQNAAASCSGTEGIIGKIDGNQDA
jgi:hypothetical protein